MLRPGLRNYIVVTVAYWSFTVTDGALRMLVLLHFHSLGYSPFQLATLFLLYEFMGIITNLVGGWCASQFGLRLTLHSGIIVQICSLGLLSMIDPDWPKSLTVVFVFCLQGLSGIAKDLSKMSSKSAVKIVTPKNQNSLLFKSTAFFTGSKNALKGIGFFIGGLLLNNTGFQEGLLIMAAALSLILILTMVTLPKTFGGDLEKTAFSSILSKSPSINFLCISRALLFGSRDVWFVVGLPVFLYDVLKWDFQTIGAFFATWVIGYGLIQSLTPRILKPNVTGYQKEIIATRTWTTYLFWVTITISISAYVAVNVSLFILGGLIVFGAIFAINSSLHSYLILALTETRQVALNVGFYYMANSIGRFFGTLFSGIMYQSHGIFGCLIVASIMIGLSAAFVTLLAHSENSL